MSEAPDPLEALLADLRPRDISAGLRQRVAKRLAGSPRPGRVRRSRIALVGVLAAASVAAVLFQWVGDRGGELKPVARQPQPAPPAVVVDSGFTLLAYERALARSPEDLDALLAKDGVGAPESKPELARVCAFTQSDATRHALLGED
jgi:hypothetical protein